MLWVFLAQCEGQHLPLRVFQYYDGSTTDPILEGFGSAVKAFLLLRFFCHLLRHQDSVTKPNFVTQATDPIFKAFTLCVRAFIFFILFYHSSIWYIKTHLLNPISWHNQLLTAFNTEECVVLVDFYGVLWRLAVTARCKEKNRHRKALGPWGTM